MPREVFTIGAEARLVPATIRTVDNTPTTIPPHWTIVSIFAGVDERKGALTMYSCLTGVDSRGDDLEGAKRALERALRHYPVDGLDIRVENGRVMSRIDRGVVNRLRNFSLWVPGHELEEQVLEATCVGFGVGIETDEQKRGYLCPYFACLIYEEQADGTQRPFVVPVRHFAPLSPESRPDVGESLKELIPDLFGKLMSKGGVGGEVHARCAHQPVSWYALESAYQDTALGQAFAAVDFKTGTLQQEM